MASTLQNLLKNKAEKDAKQSDNKSLPSSTNQYQAVPTTNHPPVLLTHPNLKTPTSPTKNFTKVPNSVMSEAIPQGLFKGLSKHTYDVLYKLTRGAINPKRKIQLTRLELMKLTGLSENTQRAHVKYLSVAGLLKITYQTGKHEGATYEILVPEELSMTTSTNPYQVVPTTTDQYQLEVSSPQECQDLVPVTSQNLAGVGTTNVLENQEVNDSLKLNKKTNTKNDDEREVEFESFLLMATKLNIAVKKLTGKSASKHEAERWSELADLLILQLEIAAKRTQSISSVPAFLTEVLRRQFFASRQQQSSSSASSPKVKVDTVGKPDSGTYEIKPLDERGREAALEQLREFATDDFLQDFKKWYTPEDWTWLIEQLEK